MPFPFQWFIAPCPEGTINVRETWRTDGTAHDLAQIISAPDAPFDPTNPFDDRTSFVCFPSETKVDGRPVKAAAAALLAHLETMPHEGPRGPAGQPGPAGPRGFAAEFPTLGTPDFTTFLQTITATLGALGGREPTTGRFPGFPAPIGLEPVLPGSTVNTPVVLGSTGDPGGVRRPKFPDEAQQDRAIQIGELLFRFHALRRARQNADKQRRNQEKYLANRFELLRRAAMPFGQSGSGFSEGGGPNGGRDFIGGALSDFFDWLARQLPGPGDPTRLPFPPNGGGAPPGNGFPQLPGGGGGGCPPLFRGGMPARVSPVPWFPVQAPNGKWFFFGHLGRPSFSRLKKPRRHHHHRKR